MCFYALNEIISIDSGDGLVSSHYLNQWWTNPLIHYYYKIMIWPKKYITFLSFGACILYISFARVRTGMTHVYTNLTLCYRMWPPRSIASIIMYQETLRKSGMLYDILHQEQLGTTCVRSKASIESFCWRIKVGNADNTYTIISISLKTQVFNANSVLRMSW